MLLKKELLAQTAPALEAVLTGNLKAWGKPGRFAGAVPLVAAPRACAAPMPASVNPLPAPLHS